MALSRGRQWIAVHGLGSGRAGAAGIILGPNMLTNPNGAYGSAPWALTNLTETTGQTDPLGGTTASLLTDNATNAFHSFQQTFTVTPASKYLVTAYLKPGTFGFGMTVTDGTNWAYGVDNTGANNTTATAITNYKSISVGGFFKTSVNVTAMANTFIVRFNYFNAAYAGTVQNETIWGLSVQTST